MSFPRTALIAAALILGCDDAPPPAARARAPIAESLVATGAASAEAIVASARAPIAEPLVATGAASVEAIVAIVAHDAACAPAPPALVCTGTLIEPDVVLTAAHCLDKDSPSSLDVIAGAELGAVRARVRSGAKHPGFERATFTHDIAVLVLARPLAVAPIPLRRVPLDAIGATLEVGGYGGAPGDPADAVRQRRGHVRLGAIEDQRIQLLPGPSMTCRGDSGGPVLARNGDRLELVGVTTHGDPACREHGFAARTDQHLDFIEEQLAAAHAPSSSRASSSSRAPSSSRASAPPRRPFNPGEDLCRATCARDDDCPAGLACIVAEQRCSFEGLPPARFTASCTTGCDGDRPCVRVSESQCRCFDPCNAPETPAIKER